MTAPRLSERMRCVAEMVSPGGRVCDVGCDHGFVSVYLIQREIASLVIATDIARGPLSRAQAHIRAYGLEERIETRLSDGLEEVSAADRIDTVILAGMGGPLMKRIMEQALCRGLVIEEYVLQPQSRQEELRAFLRESGYQLVREDMICEDGKYYPVMKARAPRGKGDLQDALQGQEAEAAAEEALVLRAQDRFGPLLLKEKNPVLFRFLGQQREKFEAVRAQCLREGADTAAADDQLSVIEAGLKYFIETKGGCHAL